MVYGKWPFMTGEKLREYLTSRTFQGKKIIFSELADKLGVSPQNLQKKFKTEDVGTGVVQDIANILGVSVSDILEGKESLRISEPNTPYTMPYKDKYLATLEKLAELQQQLIESEREKVELLKQVHGIKAKP